MKEFQKREVSISRQTQKVKILIIIAAALLVAVSPLEAQTKRELKIAKSEAASAEKSIRKENVALYCKKY